MFDMMKKLQQAQAEMEKIKARLDLISVEGVSPEGKVRVTSTGNRKIIGIGFDDSLLQDKDMLEDYTLLAINDALQKADKVNEAEMRAVAGSMMPGMGGLF